MSDPDFDARKLRREIRFATWIAVIMIALTVILLIRTLRL
jgi:ABC-type lipoprotein release transport system permease subunit